MKARALLFFVALAACRDSLPPSGQLVVYVTTDAPLPAAPGDELLPTEPRALFDRLRIEVTKPGEDAPCDGCSRDFEIDRTTVDEGRASIGIVPQANTPGYRARVRLFTERWALAGAPNPDSTIDVTVDLPPVSAEGITEVTVALNTDDVGTPIGPIAPASGPPPSGLAGTWPGAQRVPCSGAPKKGEACIPGGAYWMGTPPSLVLEAADTLIQQRIVILSPFFLGTTEVTVAEMRASKLATAGDPDSACGGIWTDDAGGNEDLPVDCLSWSLARSYCKKHGGDLPTEAQFEYVAGGTESDTYVWGDDAPTCGDASFGHTFGLGDTIIVGQCNLQGGPRAPGSGLRDRLLLPNADVSQEIVDIAGNLSELTLDDWNIDPKGSCWKPGVTENPLCTVRAKDGSRTVRGGNIVSGPEGLRASSRSAGGGQDAKVGFRCVRPDTP